jgi:hypothetical protein
MLINAAVTKDRCHCDGKHSHLMLSDMSPSSIRWGDIGQFGCLWILVRRQVDNFMGDILIWWCCGSLMKTWKTVSIFKWAYRPRRHSWLVVYHGNWLCRHSWLVVYHGNWLCRPQDYRCIDYRFLCYFAFFVIQILGDFCDFIRPWVRRVIALQRSTESCSSLA